MAGRDTTWLPLGLTCIATGVAAITIAFAYPYGTVTAMGPGFVPTAVAILLILFGCIILFNRGADVPVDKDAAPTAPAFAAEGPWRAMLAIGVAIVLFGLGIGPLGLPITVFLVVIVAGYAEPKAQPVPLVMLAGFLAAASSLIFITFLGLNLRLLPQFS